LFCLNRRLWLTIKIFVCLFIRKSSPMIHCGNRRQSAIYTENSGFASPTLGQHISTFRGYRILFSIRNSYINRFTDHFSIHSYPSYPQKAVLHSITARFCLRSYDLTTEESRTTWWPVLLVFNATFNNMSVRIYNMVTSFIGVQHHFQQCVRYNVHV
jgi:hypothetical protein